MEHAQPRYLEAKRTVDERAYDRRVHEVLLARLPDAPTVIELAAGTGVTVPRLLDWGIDRGRYRGIELDEDLVQTARERRPVDLADAGYAVERTDGGVRVGGDDGESLSVRFEVGDALAVGPATADLVVAQAFADLVPVADLLETLHDLLGVGGLAYLPITFDGETLFQPDHPADERVVGAYHDAIDAVPGRNTRAGRHLLDELRRASGTLVAAGASDWVVHPVDDGYPADEAHFLGCILDFVADALAERPVEGDDDWLATRRAQLDAGELTYVAHGYDLLYEGPP